MQTIAFQCRNCGQCCGLMYFPPTDKKRINHYLKTEVSEAEYERVMSQMRGPLTCKYRDKEKKKCLIYPVRPEICKMQGHYEGLSCPHQPQFATKSRKEGHDRLLGL